MTLTHFPKGDFWNFTWIFFPKMTLTHFPVFGFFFQNTRIGVNSHTTKSLLTVVQWYSRHLFFVVKGTKVGNNDEETILLQFNLEQKGLK